jgi:hypothetical protein
MHAAVMAVLVPLLELPPLELPPLEVLPLPELDVLPPLEPDVVSVTPSSNRTQDAAAAKPKEEMAAQPNTYFRREPEKTASVMMQRLSWARRGDALFENVGPSFTNEKMFVVERVYLTVLDSSCLAANLQRASRNGNAARASSGDTVIRLRTSPKKIPSYATGQHPPGPR